VVAVHDLTIKVFPEDLPKKLSELRFDIRKLLTYRELNAAKEAMLLRVLQKREAAVEKLQEDIKTDFEVESRKCYRYPPPITQRNRKKLVGARRQPSSLPLLRCHGRRELYQHRVHG